MQEKNILYFARRDNLLHKKRTIQRHAKALGVGTMEAGRRFVTEREWLKVKATITEE